MSFRLVKYSNFEVIFLKLNETHYIIFSVLEYRPFFNKYCQVDSFIPKEQYKKWNPTWRNLFSNSANRLIRDLNR